MSERKPSNASRMSPAVKTEPRPSGGFKKLDTAENDGAAESTKMDSIDEGTEPDIDDENDSAENDDFQWGLIVLGLFSIFVIVVVAMVNMVEKACSETDFSAQHTTLCKLVEDVSGHVKVVTEPLMEQVSQYGEQLGFNQRPVNAM